MTMRPLHRFKIKDGQLVACKNTALAEDGDLLLVNEVLYMLTDELYNIKNALLQPQYKDRDKMDEWDRKHEYALDTRKEMIEEFIKKINQ